MCATHMDATELGQPNDKQYYFLTYDVRNGLSHNTVNKIMQDRLGFIWFGTKDGLNRFDGARFRVFNKENSTLGNNYVTELLEDRDGNIWVGTDAGLYIYNPSTEEFTSIERHSGWRGSVTHTVSHINEDEKHNIWFAVDYEGLYKFDIKTRRLSKPLKSATKGVLQSNVAAFCFLKGTCWFNLYNDNLYYSKDNFKTFHPYRDRNGQSVFHKGTVYHIMAKGHLLYAGTVRGLYELDTHTGRCRKLLDGYVRSIEFKSPNELWAGTENGLYIYDTATTKTAHLTSSIENDPYALADNAIYDVFRDREGGMWIGSYFGGVNYYPHQWKYFEKYYPHGDIGFMGRRIREFCAGGDGTVWIGTEDKGLFNFNPATKKITKFDDKRIYPNVHGLCLDGGYLWIGTFSGGLNRLDLSSCRLKCYRQGDAYNMPISNDIFTFCRTRSGQLFIGTISGLMVYNRSTDDFTRVPQLANKFIYNILEDRVGDLWLATYANGVFHYDAKRHKWKNYLNNPADKRSLPYNKVISIFQDSRERLWFMTQGGGLCRYDKTGDYFARYDMSAGLPSNIVYKMVEDNSGLLWVSTNKGLVAFNPDTGGMKVYTTAERLLSDQFNYQSGFKGKDGFIYMGSINGFIRFNPATFTENKTVPPLYFTELYVFNKHVGVGGSDSPLKKSLLYSESITLSADENSFALQTASLSFRPSGQDNLRYKLEGFDKEWHTVGANGMIYYSNLPYSTYTLRIKGINADGKCNGSERSLQIRVRPPFYLSFWAYIIYALIALAVLGYGVYRVRRRVMSRQRMAMRIFEQQKVRELYNAKISFFTNITHEIRTPLTLIKGPLDNILAEQDDIPIRIKEDLKVMNINTGRLLSLVNQLLDFRKTERNGLRLNFVKCDVSGLLHKICMPFKPTLNRRSIKFDVDIHAVPDIPVDIEAFTKIISNLLTNAMKHAKTRIGITATVAGGKLKVTVCNDGNVVPQTMREDIFKPFVQYKDSETGSDTGVGTGLGLTLARSLAELHHGTLAMDDSVDTNRFVLTLPLEQAEEINVTVETNETPADETEPAENNTAKELRQDYTVLVVEDNKEMRGFIKKTLRPHYTVLTAGDGAEAVKVLKANVVNLIVSDVMMPNMDGIELCGWVKTTLDYSHIPVILLTAKTALSAKIEGTKNGADAYVEKPFSIEYLKAEIANLLKNREHLRKLFSRSPFIQTNSVTVSKTDSEFMKKVHDVVTSNMSDADFSLDALAAKMNMSRSSLNRKFKGLLDMTPNDYIRVERLKQAAKMLKEGETRITEVCYSCGFNTPSYFTKCFQKQFGMLPKDFAGKAE